jgi:hypothetical protein
MRCKIPKELRSHLCCGASEITRGHLPFLAAVSLRPESCIIDSQMGFMPGWGVLEKGIVITTTRN